MKFSEFYKIEREQKEIFHKVFNKYYNKGYFGSLDREDILEHQKLWFEKLSWFIKEKSEFELLNCLCSKESKISRELFSEITGHNVKHKTKEVVFDIVRKYVNEAKEDLK